MSASAGPDGTLAVDVAHESFARRWQLAAGTFAPVRSLTAWPGADLEPADVLVGAGGSLRVVTLSGSGDRAAQLARRAVLASGAESVLSLRSDDPAPFGERAGALRAARADVVLVNATERGSAEGIVELLEALRLACAAQTPAPRVQIVGAPGALARLRRTIPELPVDDVVAPGQDVVGAVARRAREFRRGTSGALVLRDEALEAIATALAEETRARVVLADLTGATTSLVHAAPGEPALSVHVGALGSGRAADRVVARAGLDRVRRWIPFGVDSPSLLERVFNRARWPDAVPAHPLALALQLALAHECLGHALADAAAGGLPGEIFREAQLIVLTGALAAFPRPAQSLLVAANALEPLAIATVRRERDDALLAVAGAAVSRERAHAAAPDLAAAAAALAPALAVIAPVVARGRLTLRLRSADGEVEERVPRGAFLAFPASGLVDVSFGGASGRARALAGAAGVLVDARARPLSLPPRDAERIPTVARWFAALDALPAGAGNI